MPALLVVSLTLLLTGNLTALAGNVTITGLVAGNKVYDGGTNTSLNFSSAVLVGLAPADTSNVYLITNGYSASFADKNVGSGKTVTISGLSLGGSAAGNYTLVQPVLSAGITLRDLGISASGIDKTYNGTADAVVDLNLINAVTNDEIIADYDTASFADKNVGTGKAVTVDDLFVLGTDSNNYNLTNLTATATASITARTLRVGALGVNKAYDGTTNATVTMADNHLSGDVVTESYAHAYFGDPFVGNGKTISVTGIAITDGADAGNYTLGNTSASARANITPRTLTVTASGQDKSYDGTVNAVVALSDNHLDSDDISVNYATASFADKNAGTAKTVTVSGLFITGSASDSYTLTNATVTTTANISRRSLTIVASGVNKAYDGTTNATVTLGDNRVAGDDLTDAYTNAGFADKNVGTGKTVTVIGLSISGADASDYTLASSAAATHADITTRALTVNATGQNKVYDGTTNATATLSDDGIAGDNLTDTSASASFSDKNVGKGKIVTVVGLQVSGSDSGNYALASTTTTTTANITARSISVVAMGQDKVYDGATNASITLSDNHLSGDSVADGYASAGFVDKNAASGKMIVVLGINISGTDAENYSLSVSNATCTGNITSQPLKVMATGVNKVYDGTVSATVTLSDSRIPGDAVTDGYGSASFTSSSVGNNKTVNVLNIYITGADAGNYNLTNTTAATTANITAAGVTPALTSSSNPSGYHDAISFTETLPADATGTVSFYTNGNLIASGSVGSGSYSTGSITNLIRGTNLVTAIYSGDGNYGSATNTLSQVVTNHPPVTGFFSFSVTNGIALRVRISRLLSAALDPDSDPIALVSVGVSTNGIAPATNATYIQFRNPNYLNDQFSYVITDGYGGYATGQVQVASVVLPFAGQNTAVNPSGNSAALTFHGIPDYTYVVQRSLDTLHWKSISTNQAPPNGVVQVTDSFGDLGSIPSSAFYRLEWVPGQ